MREGVPLTASKPSRIWWKVYFAILVLISVPAYISLENRRLWEIIDLLIFVPSMIGLAGFCWRKKLRNQKEWKIFFTVQLVWNLAYAYLIPLHQSVQNQMGTTVSQPMMATLNLIPYIPMVIALYKYGFKQDEFWSEE